MTTPTSPFNALKLLEQHVEHTLFLLAIDKMDMSFMPTIYDALINIKKPVKTHLTASGKLPVLTVLLYGCGGEINAAKRIALLLHDFAEKVHFIVPYHCQSACTLLVLSGQKVVASRTALFSAIDPSLTSYTANEGQPNTINSEDIRQLPDAAKSWFGASEQTISDVVLPYALQSLFPSAFTGLFRAEQEQFLITQSLLSLSQQFNCENDIQRVATALIKRFPSHHFSLRANDLISLGCPVEQDAYVEKLAWPIAKWLIGTLGSKAMTDINQPLIDAAIGTHHYLLKRERIANVPAPKWSEVTA